MKYGVIGSGNLASHLVKALVRAGYPPEFIISRNPSTGKKLARISGSPLVEQLPKTGRSTPLLLICTNDDSIPSLFKKHAQSGYILIHFSGGLPLIETGKGSAGSGVLWPVQTLSTGSRPNWKNIPLCLDASNTTTRIRLRQLARALGGPTTELDSRQRAIIHLAAVFANNFANAQFIMAKKLLDEEGLDFNILKPLILQTAQGIFQSSPDTIQTGPARRGDGAVIERQLKMLKNEPEIKAAYAAITAFLLKKYHQ